VLAAPAASRFFRELYDEVLTAAPYSDLTRNRFDDVVIRCHRRAMRLNKMNVRATSSRKAEALGASTIQGRGGAQSYERMSGTIVEEPMLKVQLVRGGRQWKKQRRDRVFRMAWHGPHV